MFDDTCIFIICLHAILQSLTICLKVCLYPRIFDIFIINFMKCNTTMFNCKSLFVCTPDQLTKNSDLPSSRKQLFRMVWLFPTNPWGFLQGFYFFYIVKTNFYFTVIIYMLQHKSLTKNYIRHKVHFIVILISPEALTVKVYLHPGLHGESPHLPMGSWRIATPPDPRPPVHCYNPPGDKI